MSIIPSEYQGLRATHLHIYGAGSLNDLKDETSARDCSVIGPTELRGTLVSVCSDNITHSPAGNDLDLLIPHKQTYCVFNI